MGQNHPRAIWLIGNRAVDEKAGIIEIIQVLADNVCALSALLVALGFAIAEIVAAWRGGGIVNFGTGGKENEQENCNRNDVACN